MWHADRRVVIRHHALRCERRPGGGGRKRDRWQAAPSHVAPERIVSSLATADLRNQLYIVGVTPYQMLTRRWPFDAADIEALLRRQLAASAPSPEYHQPGLPTALGPVEMKLLAKDVHERDQSALGLEVDLRRCSLSWETDGLITSFEPGVADLTWGAGLPWRLHGRDDKLTRLREANEGICARGGLDFVLINGSSGIGKSTLVNSLRTAASFTGHFTVGKGDAYLQEAPFARLYDPSEPGPRQRRSSVTPQDKWRKQNIGQTTCRAQAIPRSGIVRVQGGHTSSRLLTSL